MPSDLEIIKELERELGLSHPLPKRSLGERLPRGPGGEDGVPYEEITIHFAYGFFVDDGNLVIGLALSHLELKEIPSTLFKLKHLKATTFLGNDITAIPDEIITLHELERLQLYLNPITEIKLSLLDLGLPIRIAMALYEIEKGISINASSLKIPPQEIVEQGNEAIRNYFAQIEQAEGQTKYLFEAKLLIIGDGGTGKTSFRRKIMDPEAAMPEDADTTLGIEVDTWSYPIQFAQRPELGAVPFHVNLWDFGGQKIYRGTHQIFFSDKSYYVLVADTREQGTDFSYWLNTVTQLAGDDSGVLILLNKKYGHEQW